MNPERRSGFSLGQILGIPVRFHWSWLLVLGLVALSLSFGYFPLFRRALAPSSYLILGAVTAALFCASLLAHELAHALVARRERIAVRGITLFAFGGVAELADQPRTPGAELRMAAAGPLASLGLAWLFSTLADLAGSPYFALPFAWLAGTNLALGLFNLLPGFPLDGGRVLRAALWGHDGESAPGDAHRRRRRAARLLGLRPGRPGDGPHREHPQRPLAGADRVLPAHGRCRRAGGGRAPSAARAPLRRRPRTRASPATPAHAYGPPTGLPTENEAPRCDFRARPAGRGGQSLGPDLGPPSGPHSHPRRPIIRYGVGRRDRRW